MPNRDTTLSFIIEGASPTALAFGAISRQDVPSGEAATFGLASFITDGVPPVDDFSIEIQVASGFTLNSSNNFPRGCIVVGDEIHVVNSSGGVFTYELDGTYLENHSLDSQNQQSFGIAYNASDNEIYTVDFSDARYLCLR